MCIIFNLFNLLNMKSILSVLAVSFSLLFVSQNLHAQSASDTAKKALITVVNLTCDGDMPTIKKQLLNQDGIESVEFTKRNGSSSDFTILFIGGVISLEKIRKAIESTPGCDDKSITPYRVKKAKPAKSVRS